VVLLDRYVQYWLRVDLILLAPVAEEPSLLPQLGPPQLPLPAVSRLLSTNT
jgi:hypothetical protein